MKSVQGLLLPQSGDPVPRSQDSHASSPNGRVGFESQERTVVAKMSSRQHCETTVTITNLILQHCETTQLNNCQTRFPQSVAGSRAGMVTESFPLNSLQVRFLTALGALPQGINKEKQMDIGNLYYDDESDPDFYPEEEN